MEEAAKPLIFEGFKAGCNVVLHGRRGTLLHSHVSEKMSKVVLRDRRNTSARFSEYDLHFSWHALHFGRVHFYFFVAGAALWTCRAACFSRTAMSGLCQVVTTCKSRSYVFDIVRVSFCVAGTEFGEDPSCVDCYFAWQAQYLGRSTLYTLHLPLHTLHFTLRTLHFTLHTLPLYCTLYTLFTLETPHSTLETPHSTLYT